MNTKLSTPNLLLAALALAALAACNHNATGSGDATPAAASNAAVTIMAFNVENLFDNADDPGKEDRTYLALADKQTREHKAACAKIEVERWREQCLDWDWSDAMIERKLGVVAAAILQVENGRGPDIVALQEVENVGILERLRTEYLGDAGYRPAILIEGDDLRGIDVAFLTRLELAEPPTLHRIDFTGVDADRVYDTRGILEATFVRPDGSLLTGYSVHFPAPFHPTAMREAAYAALNALRAGLPADRDAFAAGDFNTTVVEDREQAMLARFARPYWTVAHEVGCDGCKGTSYYAPRDDWSFLDMILWSPAAVSGEKATWQLRADSVRIANAAEGQQRPDGTPWRFEMPGGAGVSDHWPLVVTIETK
ncbi:MAG TPA: endonuclease/exonuclease/phosphatase family protein [Woeseiaceae bacterium]|nr:endonuclease/exonuclease/phosphatase family protein [Woeseiaceae bacterium]